MTELGWRWPDIDRNSNMSSGTIRSVATHARRPSLDMMRDIAELFDVDPTQWDEWQLAQSRHMLDERDPPKGVGLEQALVNVRIFQQALEQLSTSPLGSEDRPPKSSERRSR